MPALPALLLSIYVVFLLLTMAPFSFSQANTLSAVRMGKYCDTCDNVLFKAVVQTSPSNRQRLVDKFELSFSVTDPRRFVFQPKPYWQL